MSAGASDWITKLKRASSLWLLMIPGIVGLLVFSYWPNLETVKYSFYNWDGNSVEDPVGWKNYYQVFFEDPLFWNSFAVIGVLLIANLLKMWPSIFAAIVLHRLKSDRWQYTYRILFVIPMVIPGIVGLLLWKSFFDANVGIFNLFLNATGLMTVLHGLDTVMPKIATFTAGPMLSLSDQSIWAWIVFAPFKFISVAMGGPWGLMLFGAILGAFWRGFKPALSLWLLLPGFALAAVLCWGLDPVGFPVRFAANVGLAWGIGAWLRRRDEVMAKKNVRLLMYCCIGIGLGLVLLSQVWTKPTNAFEYGTPAWLGSSSLVIPAMLLWGFPWIGTIGVLIYLAGLQNISKEVYEAADLDGIGFWGKIFKIEVPLIMTQVRISLIFMTIGTLTDYGFFLLLLGPNGGPNNVGNVPGLYMYQQAFLNGKMGYACALGMAMFVIVLYLTILNQRYIAVKK